MGLARWIGGAAVLALAGLAGISATAATDKGGRQTLSWDDLMPPGEEEKLMKMYEAYIATLSASGPIAEGSAEDKMEQIGTYNVVKELDGKEVRIPGFPVPLDLGAGGMTKEFLLVPYFGACIHTPPPPPNQIVYVKSDTPVVLSESLDAIWVEGKLAAQTKESDLADAAYTLTLAKLEPYKQ